MIGSIHKELNMKSYDENGSLISIVENGKKTYKFKNPDTGEYDDTQISYKKAKKIKIRKEKIDSGLQGTVFRRRNVENILVKIKKTDKFRNHLLSRNNFNYLHIKLLQHKERILGRPITDFFAYIHT